MNGILFRNLVIIAFIFGAVVVKAQTNATRGIFNTSRTSYEELYSESRYYQEYDLVTDTRLRFYQPLSDLHAIKVDAYLAAALQYQSAGAAQKYFDNTVTPAVGLQMQAFNKVTLQLQGGARTYITNDATKKPAEWDPRVILSAGDLWLWTPPQVFTEAYGEAVYVPRLSSTPVSTVWAKQGYRFAPMEHVYVDPYAEMYSSISHSADLGPTMTEVRMGVRTGWTASGWNIATLLYHPFNSKQSHGDIEGLLVVGGIF